MPANTNGIGFLPIKSVSSVCANLFSMDGSDKTSFMSPMTELSVNLELSSMSTPRRRLSLTETGTPPHERPPSATESLESGVDVESPLAECLDFDSPTIEHMRRKKFSSGKGFSMRRQIMARRSFSSPVMVRKPLEPLNFHDSLSSFKTIDAEEKHSDISLCEMADHFPDQLEDSSFKLKRLISGRSLSAPPDVYDNLNDTDSDSKASDDDGFFDEISKDIDSSSPHFSSSAPTDLIDLMAAPIVRRRTSSVGCDSEEDKENCLPDKEQVNELIKPVFQKPVGIPYRRTRSNSIKRDNPSDNSPSPVSRKKRPRIVRSQSVLDIHDASAVHSHANTKNFRQSASKPISKLLHRSQSFDTRTTTAAGVGITSLLDVDDKNLVGDRTMKYCLPVTESKHPDLKGITPETLADVLDGKYSNEIGSLHIIDCRYPYEFEGGHIKSAVNIYEKEVMFNEFITAPKLSADKRKILVFHCEFSSKRGPTMCRFLRNQDRSAHDHCYPQLYYPEMYLLEGGYKEFYGHKKEYCTPQSYREMFDENYSRELKLFSKRSKSWSDGDSGRYRSRRTGLRY